MTMTSKMGRRSAAVALGLVLLLICGCGRERIVDQVKIVTVLGFDQMESGFAGTALYPIFDHKGTVEMLQADGAHPKLIISRMNRQASRPLRIGKLKMIVISKEIAKEGISSLVTSLCIDPLIGSNIILAISEQPSKELLKAYKNKDAKRLPYHLIENNFTTGNTPIVYSQTFLYDFFGKGRDPSLPVIERNEYGATELAGFGVFKDERLKLTLNKDQTFLFKILQGGRTQGSIEFVVKKNGQQGKGVLVIGQGKREFKLLRQTETGGWKIEIDVELRGTINDIVGVESEQGIPSAELDKLVNDELQRRLNELVALFRDNGVDPLGLGDLIRSRDRDWQEEAFYADEYERLDCSVKLTTLFNQSVVGK